MWDLDRISGVDLLKIERKSVRNKSDDMNPKVEEVSGVLSKWTNYIHGWQSRYVVMKDGKLSYYKSRKEMNLGCRGSISLDKATVKPHEFDECRFDVSVNDCVWYLRADSRKTRDHWILFFRAMNPSCKGTVDSNLERHGSTVSLSSASSLNEDKGLREKLAEIDTYRELLCSQLDHLQRQFDILVEKSAENDGNPESTILGDECAPIDIQGEVMTFKATSEAVINLLGQCIDTMYQRDEFWSSKLDREHQKLSKLEQSYRMLRQTSVFGGPDQEEGPHSILGEDEYYDAVETGLERIEEEVALRERLSKTVLVNSDSECNDTDRHTLWPEIERVTKEQVHYASIGVGEGPWQLFAEEGDMKLYRREEELDGLVIDPLKACNIVKGVTGREMCHYFFSPQYRQDWESTLEQMQIVDKISDDTLVFLQVHKRVWPTAQRDALFWSHTTHMPDPLEPEALDVWAVVNHSTHLPHYPEKTLDCVRVKLTVCLYCQTFVDPPSLPLDQLKRENLTCKITYCSVVNPGGWVPASVLRAIYKREYPKFLKRFTAYVKGKTEDQPILL